VQIANPFSVYTIIFVNFPHLSVYVFFSIRGFISGNSLQKDASYEHLLQSFQRISQRNRYAKLHFRPASVLPRMRFCLHFLQAWLQCLIIPFGKLAENINIVNVCRQIGNSIFSQWKKLPEDYGIFHAQ